MIPRSSNPHLLQSTKVITRAELVTKDEKNSNDFLKEDLETVEYLHRLVDSSLPKWDVPDIKSNKRRKVEKIVQVEGPMRMCSSLFQFDEV